MSVVTSPEQMNAAFAAAFNSRNIENFLALYEPDAILQPDRDSSPQIGLDAIRATLEGLLDVPGTMTSTNAFCLAFENLALLRADWFIEHEGRRLAAGSSAEIVRRQSDGRWLYIVDHAAGALT